jgi:predicted methyltransferase
MTESAQPLPPLLTAAVARELFEALERGETTVEASLDLNLGGERVRLTADGASLRGIEVSAGQLRAVAQKTTAVFIVAADGLEPVEVREGGYAKLVPTDGAPTIELSGIRMHRTAGVDPFEDARLKAAAVVRPGDIVLDTCGGLGYTALWARRLGAERVVSVEKEPVVIELRRMNPWSLEFLQEGFIEKLEGDVADLILSLPDGSLSCILHDPPRFSLAGHLYGAGFIEQMRRVLRPGGRLMFYTGEPYRRGRGREFVAGVGRRLRASGFQAEWRRDLQGFICL